MTSTTTHTKRASSIWHLPMLLSVWGLLATQAGCLAKVDRVCTSSKDCQGFATQHICFQQKCVPGVCEPDPDASRPQPCYCQPGEANCDTTPKGACQQGVRFCIDNGRAWSTCFGAVSPSPEICDGKDNNCDGQIDEGLTCDCQPHQLQSCLVGMTDAQVKAPDTACKSGIQRCTNANGNWTWGECLHHHQPGRVFGALSTAIDNCQLTDLNCDGKPNPPQLDSCSCTQLGASRKCYTGPTKTLDPKTPNGALSPCQQGKQTCIPISDAIGQWSTCQGQVLPLAEEVDPCNGKDDDCDGYIDNTTGTSLPLWRSCGTDTATRCHIEICLEGAVWNQCQSQEICGNQQDDNCDGMIDEPNCFKR